VGETVDRFVDERGWTEALAVGGVEGRWPQLVGPEVAAHCVPEEFEAGRLTVRTDSTAWATQVRLLAPTLLARLNDDLGAGTVTHLQVLGPAGPSWKKGRLRVKGRGPRDTYG
jgi:predicted nucleic acid-binding Zn ribbon protein